MNWRIGISSGACVDRPILDMIPALGASGATGVEVGTPPRHFDPLQPSQVTALGKALAAAGLHAVSIHAPFGGLLDLADPNPHHRHAAVGAVLTAADAIKCLGGRLVIVHPSDLERRHHDPEARLADCARSLAALAEPCRQEGITLTVETPLPHLIGGHPDEFAWLLRQLDGSVRVCLDTGHAWLGRHWSRLVEAADGRVAHVHANDNRGSRDDHLAPGDGAIDWSEIAASLRAIDFSGWIMLELLCPATEPGAAFRRAVDRTRALLTPERPAPV